jgi:hypothetical protein
VVSVTRGPSGIAIEGEARSTDAAAGLAVSEAVGAPSTRIFVYRFPSWTKICEWTSGLRWGVETAQFSRDGRYLVLRFDAQHPPPDSAFPLDPIYFERRKSRPPVHVLLDLSVCRSVEEFQEFTFPFAGRFSADGGRYELVNPEVVWNNKPYDLGRAFDLGARRWIATR